LFICLFVDAKENVDSLIRLCVDSFIRRKSINFGIAKLSNQPIDKSTNKQ